MFKFIILLVLVSCTIEQSYNRAEKLLKNGKYDAAFSKFKKIAEKDSGELGKKAYLKMGEIMRIKKNFGLASEYYLKALASNDTQTVRSAKMGLLFSPPFIPFKEYKLKLVDAETSGRNATVEYTVVEEKPDYIKVKKNIYAGNKLTGSTIETLKIDFEATGILRDKEMILKYPYYENSEWTSGTSRFLIKERGRKLIDGIEREYIVVEEYKKGSGFAYEYVEDIGINKVYQIVGNKYKPFLRRI